MNSVAGSSKHQLEFISYIQRLLVEGDFTATYKYALLHALADICIEKPQPENPSAVLQITYDELVEKFITLYWHHALPFTSGESDLTTQLLKQSTGKQAKIITELSSCHNDSISNIRQLKQDKRWNKLRSDTLKTITEGPLWRLQVLGKNEQCFLYPHIKGGGVIQLNAGVALCFRRFYGLVIHLARQAWLAKIQSIPANLSILGPKAQLGEFLFGVDRKAITQARPLLEDIQKGNCFYCNKKLNSTTEVDHFIPFSKYANDLGHNFVVAHKKCNNSKSDLLASIEFRDQWYEQNIIQNRGLINKELSPYFNCDADRSEAITSWAYQVAEHTQAQMWHGLEQTRLSQTF